MSSLILRGKTWYLKWSDCGRDRWRSTHLRLNDDPKGNLARQVQRDFDSSRARQTAGIEDESVPILAGFERYLLTIRQATDLWQAATRARAARLAAWFAERRIDTWDQISAALLDDLIAERSKAVSPKTVIFDLDLIKATARLLNRSRTIRPLPVDQWPSIRRALAARPERIGAYSQPEIEAILRFLDTPKRQRWRQLVLGLAYLGCRWSELQRVTVADVRLEPPAVRLESRKTGKNVATQHRWVEIHPRLMVTVRELMAGKRVSDRVFPQVPGVEALKLMERTTRRLGIQYRRLHGLRHAWITSLLMAGVPVAAAMQMAGHRNLATTQRYLHVADDQRGWVQLAIPVTPSDTPIPQKTAEKDEKQTA